MVPEQTLPPVFLLLDENRESRFLLARTLLRKFPSATIEESDCAEAAVERVARDRLTAVVLHRTYNVPGVELVRMLRVVDPRLPIVMVSAIDQSTAATAAGADRFVHFDEWLLLGTVVEELLRSNAGPRPDKPSVPPETVS